MSKVGAEKSSLEDSKELKKETERPRGTSLHQDGSTGLVKSPPCLGVTLRSTSTMACTPSTELLSMARSQQERSISIPLSSTHVCEVSGQRLKTLSISVKLSADFS